MSIAPSAMYAQRTAPGPLVETGSQAPVNRSGKTTIYADHGDRFCHMATRLGSKTAGHYHSSVCVKAISHQDDIASQRGVDGVLDVGGGIGPG